MSPTSTFGSPGAGPARHGQRAVAVMLGLFSSLISLGLAALAPGFLGSIGFASPPATSLPIACDTAGLRFEAAPND